MSPQSSAHPVQPVTDSLKSAAMPAGSPRDGWSGGSPGKGPRRHGRISETEIIRAAAHSFYAYGYSETTLANVAQGLGVTDKALYYYFPNKDTLYLKTVKTCMDWVTGVIESIDSSGDDGLTKIKTFAREVIRGSGRRQPCLKNVPDHLAGTELGREIRATERAQEEILVRWVKEGIEDGSIWPADPHMLWKWNQGALIWINAWARDGAQYSPDFLEETAMTMLDRSLGNMRDH